MFRRGAKVRLANDGNDCFYPMLINKIGEVMESNKYKSKVRYKTKAGFYEVVFMNHVLEEAK